MFELLDDIAVLEGVRVGVDEELGVDEDEGLLIVWLADGVTKLGDVEAVEVSAASMLQVVLVDGPIE